MSADDLVFITQEMFPSLMEKVVKRMVQFNIQVKKDWNSGVEKRERESG